MMLHVTIIVICKINFYQCVENTFILQYSVTCSKFTYILEANNAWNLVHSNFSMILYPRKYIFVINLPYKDE